jgi:hypothetical protein
MWLRQYNGKIKTDDWQGMMDYFKDPEVWIQCKGDKS